MAIPDPSSFARAASCRDGWRWFLVGCFAVIVGVRVFLVQAFASSIAYGDDLDGIARRILLPWENGTLPWASLFAAHNGDHRIFATRVWEILWYEINGTWDPKLVMIAKVPIFAAAATIFIHLLAGQLGRLRFATAALLAVLFAFPFAFANALWAFQSQFDFFLLASALGWLALMNGRPVVALGIAAASVLTLASGPLVAASFVPYFLLQWYAGRKSGRNGRTASGQACSESPLHLAHTGPGVERDVPVALGGGRAVALTTAAIAVVALGIASPTQEAMPHAGTPSEKAATLVRLYAWPHSNLLSIVERLPESARYVPGPLLRVPNAEHSWLMRAAEVMRAHPAIAIGVDALFALLLVVPTLLLLNAVARRRIPIAAAAGPLALSTFAALMIAATAVARANQVTIAPRFLDHVSLAGFSALAAAATLLLYREKVRRVVALWAVVIGTGYLATMAITLAQMSRRAPAASLDVLQRYYHTQPHDHSAMTQNDGFRKFIVSDDPTQFMSELDTPGIERVLPLSVTAPTSAPGPAARVAFAVGRFGWLIAAAGMGLSLAAALRERRGHRSADVNVGGRIRAVVKL